MTEKKSRGLCWLSSRILAVLSNAIPRSNNERLERLAGAMRKDRKLA
jgi:hypothetical protein